MKRATIAAAAIFALLSAPTLGTAQAPDGKGNERAKAAPRAAAPSPPHGSALSDQLPEGTIAAAGASATAVKATRGGATNPARSGRTPRDGTAPRPATSTGAHSPAGR
jgi:hypothetical protein